MDNLTCIHVQIHPGIDWQLHLNQGCCFFTPHLYPRASSPRKQSNNLTCTNRFCLTPHLYPHASSPRNWHWQSHLYPHAGFAQEERMMIWPVPMCRFCPGQCWYLPKYLPPFGCPWAASMAKLCRTRDGSTSLCMYLVPVQSGTGGHQWALEQNK